MHGLDERTEVRSHAELTHEQQKALDALDVKIFAIFFLILWNYCYYKYR